MIYTFACDNCNGSFEVNVPIADNQKPLSQKCPLCGVKGKVYRVFDSSGFQYEMMNDFRKRAGSEWNDRLKTMKKGSGRGNYIEPR